MTFERHVSLALFLCIIPLVISQFPRDPNETPLFTEVSKYTTNEYRMQGVGAKALLKINTKALQTKPFVHLKIGACTGDYLMYIKQCANTTVCVDNSKWIGDEDSYDYKLHGNGLDQVEWDKICGLDGRCPTSSVYFITLISLSDELAVWFDISHNYEISERPNLRTNSRKILVRNDVLYFAPIRFSEENYSDIYYTVYWEELPIRTNAWCWYRDNRFEPRNTYRGSITFTPPKNKDIVYTVVGYRFSPYTHDYEILNLKYEMLQNNALFHYKLKLVAIITLGVWMVGAVIIFVRRQVKRGDQQRSVPLATTRNPYQHQISSPIYYTSVHNE
jgi:hypothetical protein